MKVRVKVLRAFRRWKPGDEFEVPTHEARFLVATKRAEYALLPVPVAEPVSVAADPVEEVAADEVAVKEEAEPEVEISERTGRPKRVYRRRDMTAE